MTSGLKPLGSKVLVRPTPPDTESAGGIIFPEVHSERSAQSGTVVAVGSGAASAHRIRQATIKTLRARLVDKLKLCGSTPQTAASVCDDYAAEAPALSELRVGDFVAFPFTAGTVLVADGETLIVIDEAAIEAVWQPEEHAA